MPRRQDAKKKSKKKSMFHLLTQHDPRLLNVQDEERDKGKLTYQNFLGEHDAKDMDSNANANEYEADTNCRQISVLGDL